jgi:hypothetical protein
MMRFLNPNVFGAFIPAVAVTAPVSVLAPLALSVPVTDAPVDVTATTVVVPDNKERLPEASAVVTTPPTPVVIAAIVDAIIYPL